MSKIIMLRSKKFSDLEIGQICDVDIEDAGFGGHFLCKGRRIYRVSIHFNTGEKMAYWRKLSPLELLAMEAEE